MRTSTQPRSRRTVVLAVVLPILFSVAWAAMCNLTLEFMQTGGNVNRLVTYTLGKDPVALPARH